VVMAAQSTRNVSMWNRGFIWPPWTLSVLLGPVGPV
jgi:hypothetical protein